VPLFYAEFLKSLALSPQVTVFGIIVFVAMLNLIITSASAKWAILAPIFVPMLMAVGIAPELTQVAFRVSDSAVNVVTPMFAFYPLIILYCQKYIKLAHAALYHCTACKPHHYVVCILGLGYSAGPAGRLCISQKNDVNERRKILGSL
jgi:p-aminobenzoyl-glutamate transporter AbgT